MNDKLSLIHGMNKQIVNTICIDLTLLIDSEITRVCREGFSHATYDLPVNFAINGLPRRDAQIWIYSRIIEIYESKGFTDISLELKENKSILHIKWVNDMDKKELAQREQIVLNHLMQKRPNRGHRQQYH